MNDEYPEYKKAADALMGHRSAVVLTHLYPDGDGIGSLLAMGLMLNKLECQAMCSWPRPFKLSPKYDFMPGKENIRSPRDLPRGDTLLVVLDCADLSRLGELADIVPGFPTVVNIDHHRENGMFGTVNLIKSSSSSTAEMLFHIGRRLEIPMDKYIATCLYTGLVTDTGKFQFDNTKEETLRIAAELVAEGAIPNVLYRELYQSDSLGYLKLVGMVLEKIKYDSDLGLVYSTLTRENLRATGVDLVETEDMIGNIRSLRGHKVAALFKELHDRKIRVSLRSRYDIDVCSIAKLFGGGGHKVAAGYTSPSTDMETAIEELKDSLRNQERGAAC